MAAVSDALQSQIRNIEEKYGKSMAEWSGIIRSAGKTKHGEILAYLKDEHGLSHGSANRVALTVRDADTPTDPAADPILDLFAGPKAGLLPIYRSLTVVIHGLGDDIELAPKRGYLSLRRKKQFAMIQPTTNTRVDLGLILKDTPTTDRLESAKTFNAMFTHRVRLADAAQVDSQLADWIKEAYQQAG